MKKYLCSRVLGVTGIAVMMLFAGCAMQQGNPVAQEAQVREVRQDSGKIVYWVLPGPRRLDPAVFGTKDNPKMVAKPQIKEAERGVAAGKMPPSVPGLLKELPILVGVPPMARSEDASGNLWFKKPNLFSDKAEIVSGHFNATFTDVVKNDPPGPPGKTPRRALIWLSSCRLQATTTAAPRLRSCWGSTWNYGCRGASRGGWSNTVR